MDRVFLDANILFSAAYRPDAGLLRLWHLEGVKLVTSAYALEEARLNLEEPEQHIRLDRLACALKILDRQQADFYPPEVMEFPDKDRPIFMAAIESGATHLLTGDIRHFGKYYGQTVKGIHILPPADYLHARQT
ncbi:MAG: PIN domain-containing protein [bacterium]